MTVSRTSHAARANLDPEDWQTYRADAHKLLDMALDHVEGACDRPVWQPLPEAIRAGFDEPLPMDGTAMPELGARIAAEMMAFGNGNTHPRFFGWVHGTGTAGGVVAEMMAAAMNANLGGREHAAVYVERQVIEWCRQIFGFPETAGGLLVSGTSMGTLMSLAIARDRANTKDVSLLRVYTSRESHNSVQKAIDALGLSRDQLRLVPVDATGGLHPAILRGMIDEDRQAGWLPFCLVGTAGAVNTGAFDDLNALADIADAHDLWLHVDGAFGALVVLTESHKHLVSGIERAHSLAFDFHKWLHVPYAVGCMLVRDKAWQLQTFSDKPDYLAGQERGLAAGNPWFCEFGLELSRSFWALKVWFTLKEQGLKRLGSMIEKNCAQALAITERVEVEGNLQNMVRATANIACFRYHPKGRGLLSDDQLDRINTEIVIRLQEQGVAAPSTTKFNGLVTIRVNITNHRTEMSDIDLLLDAIQNEGDRLAKATLGGAQT